jgi:hypothetical protein
MNRVLIMPVVAVLAGLSAAPGRTSAQVAPEHLGSLTCSLAEEAASDSGGLGQSRSIHCVFRYEGSGLEESYTGTLRTVGDAGQIAGNAAMIWAVRGAGDVEAGPGLLQQTFTAARPESDAAPPPLLGEGKSSLSLQPMRRRDQKEGGAIVVLGVDLQLQISTG